MDPKLRVVIVDGSAEIRAAIAALLDGERDVAVVGQAGTLRECAAADAADVVVADLRACLTDPGTLRSLRARHPALRLGLLDRRDEVVLAHTRRAGDAERSGHAL